MNGPPGTDKTTLLRDIVARVMVTRAERLAAMEDPTGGLSRLDQMDFAVVVASSNNAAVENVSLELPVRGKALDRLLWQDDDLACFADTAEAVLGVSPATPDGEHAWGLMPARLGRADNRLAFFKQFWWDPNWGLNDWLNLVAWPDAQQNRSKKLAQTDLPLRPPEALASWQTALDGSRQALVECRCLGEGLGMLADASSRLRQVEAQRPAAEERLRVAEQHLASAERAVASALSNYQTHSRQQATEVATLAALSSVALSLLLKLFRARAWQPHETSVRAQVERLNAAQDAVRASSARLEAVAAEMEHYAAEQRDALRSLDTLRTDAARLAALLEEAQADTVGAVPGPGFSALPDSGLHCAAPWNGGAFRTARDQLFIAAVRLHRAFIVAAARTIKPPLNTIARSA